jgi:hypothetical protein
MGGPCTSRGDCIDFDSNNPRRMVKKNVFPRDQTLQQVMRRMSFPSITVRMTMKVLRTSLLVGTKFVRTYGCHFQK